MMPNKFSIPYKNGVLNLSERTHIMGIINVTPDSFSDGGRFFSVDAAIEHALRLIDEGADIVDIGGESSRPGAEPVALAEELKRVLPVIEAIAKRAPVAVSIDTYKAEVARQALQCGADIVNDISGLRFDADMAATIAHSNAAGILMHIKGTPRHMQKNPYYHDVMTEIKTYLQESIARAVQAGISRRKIIIDPGIGFGKRLQDNIEIHRRLRELSDLDCPILFGSSRKSFLGQILDRPVHERLAGTIASNVQAILNGAHIIRVHEVKALKDAAQTIDALK